MTTEQNEIKSAEWRKKNLSKNSVLADVICNGYDLAYPKASKFMNTADEKLQKIIDKLTDDERETLRDRFADFYVGLLTKLK